MKQKFKVTNMSCSACAAGIEKTVGAMSGVKSVSVSLMGEYMIVDFDLPTISEDIISSVIKLGYGCSLFGENPSEKLKSHADVLKTRFIFSLIFLLPLMYFSMGGMIGIPEPSENISLALSWVLSTIVIGLNYKFFTSGVKAVIARSPNMDTLISLGSFVAYVYSAVASVIVFTGGSSTHAFFESSAMVLTLVTLGKWLEEFSKKKTGREIEKLSKMLPSVVSVKRNGEEEKISLSEVIEGDVLIVRAGDFLPIDGRVISGGGGIDKSAITGESLPIEIEVGSAVQSGCVLRSGYAEVVAEKVGEDTVFSKIIDAVREAGASKAPVQKLADKIAGIFVPVVTAIAIITFVVWLIVTHDVGRAVNFGVNVLVISCPCSLGLATPVAVMAATGKAATKGVLFKDAEALQKIGDVDCVVLDKTATITEGKPTVEKFTVYGDQTRMEEYKKICSALEACSSHPLAACVIDFCGESDYVVYSFQSVVGKGVTGKINGKEYYLGNADFVKGEKKDDFATIYLSNENETLLSFTVTDKIKPDAAAAIARLKEEGVLPVMATGDNQKTASGVASVVGISDFRAEVLPEDKLSISREYEEKGYKVAMCGDGINDSPALKGSYVGIAMGNGTDIAIESSDVVLVDGKISALCDAVAIGKKAMRLIKQNLFWAFFYNVVAIPIAAGALVPIGFSFAPWVAGACMSLSSLFVVTNALRVNSYKSVPSKNVKDDIIEKENKSDTLTLKIDGMMCNFCAGKVTDALKKLEGVESVEINLAEKTAKVKYVDSKNVNKECAKNAVDNAGYKFIEFI